MNNVRKSQSIRYLATFRILMNRSLQTAPESKNKLRILTLCFQKKFFQCIECK